MSVRIHAVLGDGKSDSVVGMELCRRGPVVKEKTVFEKERKGKERER